MEKVASLAGHGSGADKRAISDTAMITLEAYAMGGIPLAREFIAGIRSVKQDEQSWLISKGGNNISPEQAVLLRARYEGADTIVRQLVRSGKINKFVERAAGMYPFGFNITRALPVKYIETDISQDFESKPQLCAKIANDLGIRPDGRLLFAKMDAITLEGIDSVSEMLWERNYWPIGILDAGLMVYQTEEGFDKYVDAGKRLLGIRRDSLWIATDLSMRNREFIETLMGYDPAFKAYFGKIKEKLGVDYEKFFPNREKQMEFLRQKGLEVEEYTPVNLGTVLRFDGLENSPMFPERLESYLGYLSENFRTLVLKLRR